MIVGKQTFYRCPGLPISTGQQAKTNVVVAQWKIEGLVCQTELETAK